LEGAAFFFGAGFFDLLFDGMSSPSDFCNYNLPYHAPAIV
jgi:hypothetical protein